MDIAKIIEYQKKDGELFKLERELKASPSKKVMTETMIALKAAQEKSADLEKNAHEIVMEIERLKKTYADNVAMAEKLMNKDVEKLSESEINSLLDISDKIANNFNVLEKRLLARAENVNVVLNQFEQAKKHFQAAKEKHFENKKLFEVEEAKQKPAMEAIQAELKKLEADIDPKLLARYQQLRRDRIFPVFVPLNDKTCGGCRMELSALEVDKIKNAGYMECEHCRRIIFNK